MITARSGSAYAEALIKLARPAGLTGNWKNRRTFEVALALFCTVTAVIAWPHSTREIVAMAGTHQMEAFAKMLQRASTITPTEESDLRRLLAQREFDCPQTRCSAEVAAANKKIGRAHV